MSSISAGTSTGTALVSTGNTDGTLVLQTNGTTTAVTIGTNQVVTLAQPLPAASGGTGAVITPTAGGVLYGTGSAQAVTAAGTSGQVLQSNGASAPTWATPSAGYTLGTPVDTTSGTYATFTGIPAGVKSVIINFLNVQSTNTLSLHVEFGTSSAFATSGYQSTAGILSGGSLTFDASVSNFILTNTVATNNKLNGSVNFTLQNSTNNTWTSQGILSDRQGSLKMFPSAGSLNLAGVLTRLRITFGTADFAAGQINIAYL
jgi:hypothetical protein